MKSRNLFGYIKNGQFCMGRKGRSRTKLERCRILFKGKIQKGKVFS